MNMCARNYRAMILLYYIGILYFVGAKYNNIMMYNAHVTLIDSIIIPKQFHLHNLNIYTDVD